ncbi:dihydrodipicolinate synthase family protein [Bartonella sp. HY406]|uniref:dihydrodipicolinate synthase family protein n=1 Tax=Bartonella sp. HY406 TaxID=2979331 RepID=UPI0021C61151|nr:dihydrodipicolinate synthase family protein [Bartonella sp. HY406]UXN03812.1 dihydrodipicolinate synthase family protein [Bartonella sp. HY406]
MFSGLSAFPLTPMNENGVQEHHFIKLIDNLSKHDIASIGLLGSTGCYAYLNRAERLHLTQIGQEHAGDKPVMVSIGALRSRDVCHLADDAQKAGVKALLLAPLSYQPLSDAEVFGLYQNVCHNISVPLCVYDNPQTTKFVFNNELYGKICNLPNIAAIKIGQIPKELNQAKTFIKQLRQDIPSHVKIGISGDAQAARGLSAGCDCWFSVLGGLFPKLALGLQIEAENKLNGDENLVSTALLPLWRLFEKYGSLRVIATAAEILKKTDHPSLPLPLQSLSDEEHYNLSQLLNFHNFA